MAGPDQVEWPARIKSPRRIGWPCGSVDIYPTVLELAAWIDNQYKLHRIADEAGQAKYALFDLVQDSEEKADLADAQPDRLARMKSELEAWQKAVIHSLNGEDYSLRGL